MTWWAWTLLFVAGRLLGSPAADTPVPGEGAPEPSWTASERPPEMRDGVLRGIASGSRDRALRLTQAAVDLDLATPAETRAAAVWLHLYGIPSLSAAATSRELDAASRRLLEELARRLPAALLQDFRETLGVIDLPAGENGRISPQARKLLEAFFTGTARGLGRGPVIDGIDNRLRDWVKESLGKEKAEIVFGAPAETPKETTVTLTLVGVLPTPTPRTPARPPLKLVLRYLVSVQASDTEDAHRILGILAFSAMESTDYDMEMEAPEASLWPSLDVPLRASFIVRVPLLKMRPEPKVRRVRYPLVIKTTPVRSIAGVVLGPGEIPIMGAKVGIPGSGRPVETDHLGHFVIPGILRDFAPEALEVRAKGALETVPLDPKSALGDSLVIHLNSLED